MLTQGPTAAKKSISSLRTELLCPVSKKQAVQKLINSCSWCRQQQLHATWLWHLEDITKSMQPAEHLTSIHTRICVRASSKLTLMHEVAMYALAWHLTA